MTASEAARDTPSGQVAPPTGVIDTDHPMAPSIPRRVKYRLLRHRGRAVESLMRSRLCAREFTIISNDCWGGAVYQSLQRPYATPFIGLSVMAPDYLRMLADLPRYLGSPLKFTDLSRYPPLPLPPAVAARGYYPIGLLGGDVELHFLHYHTQAEAAEKWQRRLARVQFDRLFVKLSSGKDFCTEDLIREFDRLPYEHKVCFTDRRGLDLPSVIRLPDLVCDGELLYAVCLPRFAVVDWLNGGSGLRRLGALHRF
jgi:uncharacterized protein (DUF1919 family)